MATAFVVSEQPSLPKARFEKLPQSQALAVLPSSSPASGPQQSWQCRAAAGGFLVVALSVRQQGRWRRHRAPLAGRVRSAPSLVARRSNIVEDVTEALTDVTNTVEDAYLHLSRLPPWLLGTEKPKEAEVVTDSEGRAREHIVVLGTGWAGHAISKVIDTSVNDVTFVSPRNFFVFTPMLPSASVGTVEYRSITEHIRNANPLVDFCEGTCESVDVEKKEIMVRPSGRYSADEEVQSFPLKYDKLVVSVGMQPSSRGVPGVDEHCLFMKQIDDARKVRRRITECFERAALPTTSEEERRRLLTFVVVGGGPTGCEFCGEMSDFLSQDLEKFYPKLADSVRILLVQRGKTLLPIFGKELQEFAVQSLEAVGVEIVTSAKVASVGKKSLVVTRIQDDGSEVNEDLPYGMCVWAAGNRNMELVDHLRAQLPIQQESSNGRPAPLFTDQWLRVLGVPDGSILALGDCARIAELQNPLPATAQVAAQQGAYVARLLNRHYDMGGVEESTGPQLINPSLVDLLRARGFTEAPIFRFLDLGKLAYLGDEKALAEIGVGAITLTEQTGRAAFALWRSVYIVKQVSFRNRVLVLFDWIKSKVFGRDMTRF